MDTLQDKFKEKINGLRLELMVVGSKQITIAELWRDTNKIHGSDVDNLIKGYRLSVELLGTLKIYNALYIDDSMKMMEHNLKPMVDSIERKIGQLYKDII